MAIEHYSSLASNRNYKIHNASGRAGRARLAYTYKEPPGPAHSTQNN